MQRSSNIPRAQYGTTKYCSAYLRGETCTNKNCSFLHESGEDGQSTSLQNEPIISKIQPRSIVSNALSQAHISKQQASQPPPSVSSQLMHRQSSKDSDERVDHIDQPGLPSTASWASVNPVSSKIRTGNQIAAGESPSPNVNNSYLVKAEEKKRDSQPEVEAAKPAPSISVPEATISKGKAPVIQAPSAPEDPYSRIALFKSTIEAFMDPNFRFHFDSSAFTPEELADLDSRPKLIDPRGGEKLRRKREAAVAERAQTQERETTLLSQIAAATENLEEENNIEGGSLALGGEPEDNPRINTSRSAIQRPQQSGYSVADQLSTLGNRSLTPQPRQQLAAFSSGSQQTPSLGQPSVQGFGDTDQRPTPAFPSQYESSQGHIRSGSRFFANNENKQQNNQRFAGQQATAGQQHFYVSGAATMPPPGLKTAGTPPINGGSMFAQGHGFTSMTSNYGGNKDMDMLSRARSGTDNKREFLLSFQDTSHRSPPPSAPAPGLLNSLYGQFPGAYQDPGLVKQKKKGKKHRHANTSSSGGGVVDLADPSILHARANPNNSGNGQGLFSGQGQGNYNHSNIYGGGYGRW